MSDKEPIVIAVACDNHYMPLLAAMVKSVEVNHHTGEQIILYIMDDGISRMNKTRLTRSVSSEMFEIRWIPKKSVIPEGMNIPYDHSSYPLIIHMRMFIPYFVPSAYEKVIYMDVDMIVNGEISELWKTDLGSNVIGAVVDVRIKEFGNPNAVANFSELGFDKSTRYFNTGLLIINTVRWRELDMTPKVFECIEVNRKYANYPDQYGLNVVFADQWTEIGTLWSWSAEEWNPDARLVHFIWRKPIYRSYMNEEKFRVMFFNYLEQTRWKGFRPVSETRRIMKKIQNKAVKLTLLFHRASARK